MKNVTYNELCSFPPMLNGEPFESLLAFSMCLFETLNCILSTHSDDAFVGIPLNLFLPSLCAFWDIELYPFNPFWWCFCGNPVESLLALSVCLFENEKLAVCFGIYNCFPLLVEKILMLHYLKLGLELIIFQIVGLYHDKFKDQSRSSYSSLLCNQISY